MVTAAMLEEYDAWKKRQNHPELTPESFVDWYYTQEVLKAVASGVDEHCTITEAVAHLDLEEDVLDWLAARSVSGVLEETN